MLYFSNQIRAWLWPCYSQILVTSQRRGVALNRGFQVRKLAHRINYSYTGGSVSFRRKVVGCGLAVGSLES